MKNIKLIVLLLLLLSPVAVFASWDDVEADLEMMGTEEINRAEERAPTKRTPKENSYDNNSRYKSNDSYSNVAANSQGYASGYTPKPANIKLGLGIKSSAGAGEWLWEYDSYYYDQYGISDETGVYTVTQTEVLLLPSGGFAEFGLGVGTISYPSGGERSFYSFSGIINFGRGVVAPKTDKGFLPYAKLGWDALFLDYSNILTDSSTLENDSTMEMRAKLGAGVAYRLGGGLEIFVEYIYNFTILAASVYTDNTYTYSFTTTDFNDVSHNDGVVAFGVNLFL